MMWDGKKSLSQTTLKKVDLPVFLIMGLRIGFYRTSCEPVHISLSTPDVVYACQKVTN